MAAYTKQYFNNIWGKGYIEPFVGYDINLNQLYEKLIQPFINDDHIALEIGCGGGIWTNLMIDKFKEVIALDVISRPSTLNTKIKFYELNDQDYKCSNVLDNSVDFVFSFGVFCHLPVSAQFEYVENILRVLKTGGNAVVMFADWETHPTPLNKGQYEYKETVSNMGWFYMDTDIIKEIMDKNNISEYENIMPTFRDRIIHFCKK